MASNSQSNDSPRIGYDHLTVVPEKSGPENSVRDIINRVFDNE